MSGLTPSDRIRTSAEYQRLSSRGRRIHGSLVTLVSAPGDSARPRLGIVVSKKQGGAVVRNRWKRVIRETFRLNRELLSSGGDHVVIVRRHVKGKPPPEVRDELKGLFAKAASRP